MNKTIKRIVALGTGALMLGATAFAAYAFDLSNYPAPFVTNGVFAGKIVIGEKAASIDTVGALDIAASLQRAASTTVSTGGGTTSVQGGFRLDTSSDRIYLGDGFSVDSVTSDNLDILKDNQFEDDAGTTYDYTQSIAFPKDTTLSYGQHGLSDVDSFLGFDLRSSISTTDNLYVTKVDFTKAVNATKTDVVGNKIILFGNEYTFSSESTGDKLVMYGSAKEVSLTTKDTVTQTIDGKDYKVNVVGFDSNKVVVSVNGDSQSITEGTSKTVGGLKIYAKSVSSWNNGLDGFATLQLGANKIVLEDGQEIALGVSETSVSGTLVALGGTTGRKTETLTSIYVYVNAPDSDMYIGEGKNAFVDPLYGSFKIAYENTAGGLSDTSRDMLEVKPSGSSKAYVKLPVIGQTDAKTVTFDYQGNLMWDSTKTIFPYENASVSENDYTYLAPADEKYTHLVKLKTIHMHATDGYATYEDALTGADYETEHGAFDTVGEGRSLTVDGKTYNVVLTDSTPGAPFAAVEYHDGKIVVFPEIALKNGETFALLGNITGSWVNATTFVFPGSKTGGTSITGLNLNANPTVSNVTYTVTDVAGLITAVQVAGSPAVLVKEAQDTNSKNSIVLVTTTYDSSSTGVNVGSVTFNGHASGISSQSMADSDTDGYVDYFGTYVTRYHPSGNNNVDVKIWVPSDQMYANVFIEPLGAAVSTTAPTGAVSLNPIAVGLAIMDSQATLGSTPYIVVGGPCANTIAATLMGNPTDCGAGFTQGQAKIKLFADQNALLVAGFSGQDTQGACRVLAYYGDYAANFKGTELSVVTANLASLSVTNVQ